MAETIIDRAACENCGADVRDGTTFCYNCGKSVNAESSEPAAAVHSSNGSSVSPEGQAALDDLAQRLRIDETTSEENKLAQAAAERKRARVRSRQNETVWEAADPGVNVILVAATLLIVVLTAIVVLAAVYWK